MSDIRQRFLGCGLAVLAVLIGVVATTTEASVSGAEAVAGEAGTDTSLPDTDSAVVVRGRGAYRDLEITVNQTVDLGNQAISLKWSGGSPTRAEGRTFGSDFLQVMQCWGDDDGSNPANPGPPPEQCVFGASDAEPGGGRNSLLFANGSYADDRIIARTSFERFDPEDGFVEDETAQQWLPFRAVDGEVVNSHTDPNFSGFLGGEYWRNPYFNYITTNEVAGARTLEDGTGQELFEVATGLESSGLGCGQKVLAGQNGSREIPKCWLVVVPRGSAATENAGTIAGQVFADNPLVMTSPLAPQAWEHRIAIPLEFNPVDTPCDLADDSTRIVGSELLIRAVSSWQPVLCTLPGVLPYSYAVVPDASARLQITGGTEGAPGMAVVSRPLDPVVVTEDNPTVYAPLAASAMVIGFNIERVSDAEVSPPGSAVDRLNGVRVADLNLTPRLVAKLLSQSYAGQVSIFSAPPDDYEWVESNPGNVDLDPDFLRFNPEFELLTTRASKNLGGAVLAAGTSDAAEQVWSWILADPEAKAWLAGEPDEWGMRVNPTFSTSADLNPSGVGFAPPPPTSFPKSDPLCHQEPSITVSGREIVPPVLCGTDWLPYALSYRDAAKAARTANDGAKTQPNSFAETAQQYWRSAGPQIPGTRAIFAVVDSASARQYGLQMANLSRAGDNADRRTFVGPDEAAITAAVQAMEPMEGTPVLAADPLAMPDDAYPLSVLAYAASAPMMLSEEARAQYAAFVDYAAGAGQQAGEALGQLPPGYAPLPAGLRAEAEAAADLIRDPASLITAPTSTTSTTTPAPTTVPATGLPAVVEPVASTPIVVAPVIPQTVVDLPPSSSPEMPVEPIAVPESAAPELTDDDIAAPVAPAATAMTPVSSVGGTRFAVPVLALFGLMSALGALELTKARSRYRVRVRTAVTTEDAT